MHYCMGELSDWGISSDNTKTCSKCGMAESDEKDDNCCNDELTFVKNNADQRFAKISLVIPLVLVAALPVSFNEAQSNDFTSLTKENPISPAPLRCNGTAVYIRNCVFLI